MSMNTLNSKKISLKDSSMLIFLIALFLICSIFVPRFISPVNIINVLTQIAINALIAVGMTFVILSDGIDLSVGSVAAISGVMASSIIKLMPNSNVFTGVLVIFATAVVVGVICGGINAFNVAKLKVPPFIATLAMMSVARGTAFLITDSKPVSGLPDHFNWLGLRYIGPIPAIVILMIIVLISGHIILTKTCFGRHIYAVGSNEEVSKLSGIDVVKIKSSVYIICSVLAALAGGVLASKLQAGQPSAAQSYELNAIAAVAMGGTSMSGGKGGIAQTLLGLFIIGIINNSLSLLQVSSHIQTISMGIIILLAVIFDMRKSD